MEQTANISAFDGNAAMPFPQRSAISTKEVASVDVSDNMLSIPERSQQLNWQELKEKYPLAIHLDGTLSQRVEQMKLLQEYMYGKRGKKAAAIMVAALESTMLDNIPWKLVNKSFEAGVGKEEYYNAPKKEYIEHPDKRPPHFDSIKKIFANKVQELRLRS